jgi:NAD-dependent dihydropyrimidine dehydrogenase PreA subunit
MKRATFDWRERLDAAVGSLFSIYLLIAVGFLVFGRHLLLDYLWSAAAAALVFMLVCPWLPGKAGWKKVLAFNLALGCALILCEVLWESNPVRAPLIIAMASLFVFGGELGGVSSTMPSEFDPWMAKLGIKKLGNTYFAGTIRAELLAGMRELTVDRERCVACGSCVEICPQGVWELDADNRAVPARLLRCTACRACLVQCKGEAIKADRIQKETS